MYNDYSVFYVVMYFVNKLQFKVVPIVYVVNINQRLVFVVLFFIRSSFAILYCKQFNFLADNAHAGLILCLYLIFAVK